MSQVGLNTYQPKSWQGIEIEKVGCISKWRAFSVMGEVAAFFGMEGCLFSLTQAQASGWL